MALHCVEDVVPAPVAWTLISLDWDGQGRELPGYRGAENIFCLVSETNLSYGAYGVRDSKDLKMRQNYVNYTNKLILP